MIYYAKLFSILFIQLTFLITLNAQHVINGKITDADSGEPLIGASVLVSNTTTGAITDIEGLYELLVPDTARSISFSYAGYKEQQVFINGANTY